VSVENVQHSQAERVLVVSSAREQAGKRSKDF